MLAWEEVRLEAREGYLYGASSGHMLFLTSKIVASSACDIT